MKMLSVILFISLSFLLSCKQKQQVKQWIAHAPAGMDYTTSDRTGRTIIPNGRIIQPMGKQIKVAPHPFGLTLSMDGNIAVTANSGISPFSITVIHDILSDNPSVRQIPEGPFTDEGVLASVFMGLAISHDQTRVFIAGGEENKVFIFNLDSGEKESEINCSINDTAGDYSHGYLGDMVLSHDENWLYIVDQINFCVNIIHIPSEKLTTRVMVGRYPFGIALSPDGTEIYVANVGMYEYQLIKGIDRERIRKTAPDNPVAGYLTPESIEGYTNDSLEVPGLGDPNVPESFSVWTVNIEEHEKPDVIARTKTGFLVGQLIEGIPAVGGSSPNSVIATENYVFVSNGNNDCISVIDTEKDTVVETIFLTLDERLGSLRGIIPFGLALSHDQKRLYVAESGINAVGIIDVPTLKLIGHIPVGWFPSKLQVTPDGKKLIVTNAKGCGSGPNGGEQFQSSLAGSYIGFLMHGSVSVLSIPKDEELEAYTREVNKNNFNFQNPEWPVHDWRRNNPVPLYSGYSTSPIKHLIFITKENRTYDEVFGQMEGGKGDPDLARYGMNASFWNRTRTDSVQDADIMVNHLALARQFSISDNFYVDSDVSADGHRWLACTYPNEWVESSVPAAYGGKRNMRMESNAPGNLAFVGSTGAIYPEDMNEAGSMWEQFSRNDISFFNFGESVELAPSYSDSTMKYAGIRYLINYPVPAPVHENTSKLYATYNMAIPDQFRADMFIKEFNDRWMGEGKTMPQVLTILLPNDHGAGDRPHAGYPFRESYMADNDLALGRIVEFLSHTPYWDSMAIVITEDDAQDGVDHVDAHRSLLMVVSPYAKRNLVSHYHYSFGSIFKTFWHILGLPYLNQYDAGATDLADMFTDQPDFTPYTAIPVDLRVFDPQKALDPFDEQFDWKAVAESPRLDDQQDIIQGQKHQ